MVARHIKVNESIGFNILSFEHVTDIIYSSIMNYLKFLTLFLYFYVVCFDFLATIDNYV